MRCVCPSVQCPSDYREKSEFCQYRKLGTSLGSVCHQKIRHYKHMFCSGSCRHCQWSQNIDCHRAESDPGIKGSQALCRLSSLSSGLLGLSTPGLFFQCPFSPPTSSSATNIFVVNLPASSRLQAVIRQFPSNQTVSEFSSVPPSGAISLKPLLAEYFIF